MARARAWKSCTKFCCPWPFDEPLSCPIAWLNGTDVPQKLTLTLTCSSTIVCVRRDVVERHLMSRKRCCD
jgi:hypothetical protein